MTAAAKPTTAAKQRAAKAAYSRKLSASVRGVTIPPVKNRKRRDRCRRDLRQFCETYLAARFNLAWSADHLRCIAKLETAVLDGGQFAFAMPRGSGKTALVVAAALWCILYGHRRFVVLVGATDDAAVELLDSIKAAIETNDLIAADFPAAAVPVRELEGIHNRAGGQYDERTGERTRITWTDSEVILPTVKVGRKPAPSSGAVVRARGLTGRVRGMSHSTAGGETIRPDLVILDDPQTDESAESPAQNAKRERIISKAVLGLAGPKVKIAAVMPCTVIAPGDMVDRALDRDLNPQWQGERTKLLYEFPANAELWDRYAELRRESLQAEQGITLATEFYRANREAMDAGARAAWPERFNDDELSAVQFAMNLKIANYAAFMAEYQNDPVRLTFGGDAKQLDAGALAKRLSGSPRFQVPRECTRLTAGIDLGVRLAWYTVTAWTEAGGGVVVDYGCWPRQARAVFDAADARPSLIDAYPRHTESQIVFASLRDLAAEVLGRAYPREGGGETKVEKALVDAGWQSEAVYQAVRASTFAGVLLPSKGFGRTTTSVGVGSWKARPGERVGHAWKVTAGEGGKGRLVAFDPDVWKSILHERLTTPPGGGTAITLFGKDPQAHALVSEHLAAEYSTPATVRGQTFDKWTVRPDRSDNHLLDAAVLAAVAASVAGLTWTATGQPADRTKAEPLDLGAEQRKRRAERFAASPGGRR